MILDTQNQFASAQTPIALGDTPSTNVLDFGVAADSGAGDQLYLLVRVAATVTSAGAATVQIVYQDSADNATWRDVLPSAAFALAALTVNSLIVRSPLPIGLRRYQRIVYRIGTAVLTGGAFSAYLAESVQAQQYGASGFAVA